MPIPTAIEQKAFDFIENQRDEIIAFTIQMIQTPSSNPPGNEVEVARVVEEHLHSLGLLNTEIIESKPRRANLLCRFLLDNPGNTLLLNGHLDTKPPVPLEKWKTDPYKGVIQDERLYGLGSADMKGPDAALVYGLAAARECVTGSQQGQVLLVLNADEEYYAMEGARYLVMEKGIRADAGLIAEPVGINKSWECIPLISRGISCIRWHVKGTQTHSSICDRIPVVNATLEASRLLLFLEKHLELHYQKTPLVPLGPTINLGSTFKAGIAHAIVSGEAEFTADIRILPGMTQNQLASDINRAVAAFRKERPGVDVSWEFYSGTLGWLHPTQISSNEPLVEALAYAASRVLGKAPPLGYFPGGTDAIWWQGLGNIPTIPGFGPGLLTNCHQPNEYIVLEEIIQAAKIYALMILEYLV